MIQNYVFIWGMAIATALAEAGEKILVNDISQEKLDKAKAQYIEKNREVADYKNQGF